MTKKPHPIETLIRQLAWVKRGFGAGLTSAVVALSFALFAHVVTCDPCYDDDICASARIESALVQTVQIQALDVGNADPGGNGKALFQAVPERVVLLTAVDNLAAVSADAKGVVHDEPLRNSSLAHRQIVVLVI